MADERQGIQPVAICGIQKFCLLNHYGRIDLYTNYLRKPENIDVLMNNLLTINISNVFAANLLVDIIYDDDIKKRTQIQEIFGLGLKVKL